MFNLFKKKIQENAVAVPESASVDGGVPAPLDGRQSAVGGIESLILDGVTYYFGFDYSRDLVVSPLIDDIDVMARFASQHMMQRDGSHDVTYWRELAAFDSELCSDILGRTFLTQELTQVTSHLRAAQASNAPAPHLNVGYHLRYLLASAGNWAASGEGFESADKSILCLRGEEPLPMDTSFSGIAHNLQAHLSELIDSAPENWSTLFAALKS